MDLTLTPILGISGSLRRDSLNSAALRAIARIAEDVGAPFLIDDLVRALPPFDPDAEGKPPIPVERFRMRCAGAAGVLVAVPEYAFGIPGAFKNALDWTVGSVCLNRKPLAVLNVAPEGRGLHVQDALADVFTALDAEVVFHKLPIVRGDLDDAGNVTSRRVFDELGAVLINLVARAGADSGLRDMRLSAGRHNE